MRKKKPCAVSLVLAALLAAAPARAGEHLVATSLISTRISEAAANREVNLEALEGVLASEAGLQAARLLGSEPEDVRRQLSTLSDREVEDLARRASALRLDPVAGYHYELEHMLWIVLLVVLIIFVVQRID